MMVQLRTFILSVQFMMKNAICEDNNTKSTIKKM